MKRKNELKIKKSILNPIDVHYNHHYLYKSFHAILVSGKDRLVLDFRDNYEKNFGIRSLNEALLQIEKAKSKYLYLREYKSGFAAYVSDKYESSYESNDRYRQIAIQINEYNSEYISDMLIDMMMARTHYTNYRLTSAKIDTNENLILESKESELVISNWRTNIILPDFDELHNTMYQLGENYKLKGWYSVVPLSSVNTNENNMRSVILTRKELEENIIALIECTKNHIA